MSILIKGMEIPKENEVICIFPNGIVQKRVIKWSRLYEVLERSNAVPVPPHGRLIDADALDTSIFQAGFSYAITRRKLKYTPGDVRQKIANAPTVIPATEEEP